MSDDIRSLIDNTPFVDTHEHLWEESHRIASLDQPNEWHIAPADFSIFFNQYSLHDLESAGMSSASLSRFNSHEVEPEEKWQLVEPYYAATRHTGYLQCTRESLRMLLGEHDFEASNVNEISRMVRDLIKPGYYHHILKDVSNIEYAQVNSLERTPFMETEYPELLTQDLSFLHFSNSIDLGLGRLADIEVNSLEAWHQVIDWCFATYGPRAIAVKNQGAYMRRLDYAPVPAKDAAPVFERFIKDASSLSDTDHKLIQDHLFHYCIAKATEYKLPVKLHTGYYAGVRNMPLARLQNNASDLCPILQQYPDTPFILMHIDYPYQDEAIALAKHFPNVYIDMCWAWIINPSASKRFLKEYLVAAPANKIFTFGGDFMPVEQVPGHAFVARKGIAEALNELITEDWIPASEVDSLVERLMRGNAHALFDYEGVLSRW